MGGSGGAAAFAATVAALVAFQNRWRPRSRINSSLTNITTYRWKYSTERPTVIETQCKTLAEDGDQHRAYVGGGTTPQTSNSITNRSELAEMGIVGGVIGGARERCLYIEIDGQRVQLDPAGIERARRKDQRSGREDRRGRSCRSRRTSERVTRAA
jgi:hypothetical protein